MSKIVNDNIGILDGMTALYCAVSDKSSMDDVVVVKGCSPVTNDPKTFPTLSFSVGSNCVEGISGASDTVAKPFVQCKTYWCWAATVARMTFGKRKPGIDDTILKEPLAHGFFGNGDIVELAGGIHYENHIKMYMHLDKTQNYIVQNFRRKGRGENEGDGVVEQMNAIKALTDKTAYHCLPLFLKSGEIQYDIVKKFVIEPLKKEYDLILICVRKDYEGRDPSQWQGHSFVLKAIEGNKFIIYDPMFDKEERHTIEELFRDGFLCNAYIVPYNAIVYDCIYFWEQLEKSTRDQVLKEEGSTRETTSK